MGERVAQRQSVAKASTAPSTAGPSTRVWVSRQCP